MGWFGNKDKKSKDKTRATSSAAAGMSSAGLNPPPRGQSSTSRQHASSSPRHFPASTSRAEPEKESPPRDNDVSDRLGNDDEAIMVIDNPPEPQQNAAYHVEDSSIPSFSKDEEVLTHVGDGPRQSHLNSLFNGHLMKWKYEAEEGSVFIRVPAFVGAIGLLTTAILSLVLYPTAWQVHSIVLSCAVVILATFILILDGRFLSSSPLSARAHLRNVMTRNFNIFRFVWGRGLLYIVAGVLSVAEMELIMMISGAVMILIGSIAFCVGVHASRKFASLRSSLADESYLLLVFSNYDSDGDGYITPSEFSNLLTDLGMELDDRYTLKAFNVIDSDNDRLISFEEFNHWWASGYIERGRRRRDEEDDPMYRRMY